MLDGLDKTQYETAVLLDQLIQSNSFPASVLFSGSNCTGRMYASLAIAKYFGADLDSTVIISDRNHNYRISAALKLFREKRNNKAKNFLYAAVSTFLKQYHGALFDSNSPANRKKFSDAADCMDLLNELKDVDENKAESFASNLEKAIAKILVLSKTATYSRSGAVTVNQIRDIRDWCYTSSNDGKEKFVIIEGLENALDASSNALLKILEEPPDMTHFILISSNPGQIPQTILSRVREFKFNDFTEKEKKYVLSSLFVNPDNYTDINSFFIEYGGVNDKMLCASAESIIDNTSYNLPKLIEELENTQAWDRFFEYIIKTIQLRYTEGKISEKICVNLTNEITSVVSKGKAYNQTKRLTFDFVVFRIKEYLL